MYELAPVLDSIPYKFYDLPVDFRRKGLQHLKGLTMQSTHKVQKTSISEAISRDAEMVRDALIQRHLETPMTNTTMGREEKYERIKQAMAEVAEVLGLDLQDDSLAETPHRIAKMYVDEIFSGLDYSRFPSNSTISNKMGIDEPVTVSDISVVSTCEHHFITIDGFAKVAYRPAEKLIGLSKINRIVRFFCQRPQVQERLTRQILVALQTLLETEDVAVAIDATHYCVKARGVMDSGSHTMTKALDGAFKTDPAMRQEFLSGFSS